MELELIKQKFPIGTWIENYPYGAKYKIIGIPYETKEGIRVKCEVYDNNKSRTKDIDNTYECLLYSSSNGSMMNICGTSKMYTIW